MGFVRFVVLAAWCAALAGTQRTYERSCDCEYTKDGKCAYTLILPAPGGKGSGPQCPSVSKPDAEASAEVKGQVEWLRANMTELRLTAGDQARMLSQLQSLLMTQQESLATLGGLVRELPTRPQPPPQGGDPTPCEVCTEVQEAVGAQQRALEALQKGLEETQTSVGQLGVSFANIGQLFSMEEITRMIQEQQNRTVALQRSLAEFVRNASVAMAAATAAGGRASQGFGCFRRGLLVSGPAQNVTDAAITASSRYNDGHGAVRGRIYTQADVTLKGAWCAEEPNDPEEWLQFDLGKPKSIFGVVTKGRSDYGQWVTTYSLNYTDTDPASDTARWDSYMDVLGEKVIFTGNMDQNTAKMNMLWQPIRARYIRVIPLTSDSNKCMRADVIGCLDEQ